MLDHTERIRERIGGAILTLQSSRYIPKESGIYQIIVIPHSFGCDDAYSSYFTNFDSFPINYRDRLNPSVTTNKNEITVTLRKKRITYDAPAKDIKYLLEVAAMMPPVYVGRSENLKSRFMDHCRGSNSRVIEQIRESKLEDLVVFFKWYLCKKERLVAVESTLIQMHKPVFNIQRR